MSITMVASIQVADFDDWKAIFDTFETDRVSAGIHANAYRNIDSENNAVAIVTAPSKDTIITFFMRPESQEAMKKAGVLAPPEMTFLEET